MLEEQPLGVCTIFKRVGVIGANEIRGGKEWQLMWCFVNYGKEFGFDYKCK